MWIFYSPLNDGEILKSGVTIIVPIFLYKNKKKALFVWVQLKMAGAVLWHQTFAKLNLSCTRLFIKFIHFYSFMLLTLVREIKYYTQII